MQWHVRIWLATGILLGSPAARADAPTQPQFGAPMEHAPEEDLSLPVQALELRLDTPGDVVGKNFKPADLLGFGGRTDRAAKGALLKLHPAHRLEVSIRYTLSADKAHDVQLTFVPDEVKPEDAAALRSTLLQVPTIRSSADVVSFTRTYSVRGVNDLKNADAPPRWGVSVPDSGADESAAAAVNEIATGKTFAHFGRALILGPMLYKSLGQQNAEVKTLGIPLKILRPSPKGTQKLEGRLYRAEEVTRLLRLDVTRALGERFRKGHGRAATTAERGAFYSLITFELAGIPLPVVQEGKDVLLVESMQQSVLWLELISEWRR